jgi:hypothetical protein
MTEKKSAKSDSSKKKSSGSRKSAGSETAKKESHATPLETSPETSPETSDDTSPLEPLGPQPPSTYTGVVLLGWMERDQAVRFLMEDCRFEKPLTESDAEGVWRKWRDRAATLPERQALAPEAVPLTASENAHAARFLQFIGALGVSGVQVVKIDPLQLVVGQYHIAIDVAAAHAGRPHDDEGWMEHLLPSSPSNPKLDMNFTRRNFDTEIMIDLPHAEFIFGVHSHGGFGPKEMLGYVMAIRIGNRMMLGKGYHRLYSRISACRGSFPERLSLVALDPSTLTPPPPDTAQAGAASSSHGLEIFGARPAVFADFFTEGLAMPVYLRRKRYQLQVRATWVAINEA